jgi:hypothetical protein
MRRVFKLIIVLALVSAYHFGAKAQDKSTSEYYHNYYTGCWKTTYPGDGYLITEADGTFQWLKPGAVTNRTDTSRGIWRIRSRYGIPFKATVLVLKCSKKAGRRAYEIDVTSRPAVIYLTNGHRFYKVNCE